MPQTMQQKRQGSLARLKESAAYHERAAAGAKLADTANKHFASIVNLTRMIAETEAAIQKGGR